MGSSLSRTLIVRISFLPSPFCKVIIIAHTLFYVHIVLMHIALHCLEFAAQKFVYLLLIRSVNHTVYITIHTWTITHRLLFKWNWFVFTRNLLLMCIYQQITPPKICAPTLFFASAIFWSDFSLIVLIFACLFTGSVREPRFTYPQGHWFFGQIWRFHTGTM